MRNGHLLARAPALRRVHARDLPHLLVDDRTGRQAPGRRHTKSLLAAALAERHQAPLRRFDLLPRDLVHGLDCRALGGRVLPRAVVTRARVLVDQRWRVPLRMG